MPGPGFSWVFGGSTVQPANVSYLALALSANTTMVWPPQAPSGSVVVARIMDVTPSGGGLTLTMPPANQASAGFDCLVTNKGASTFTLLTNTGVTIASIVAGQQYYVYLTDPTTLSGTWNAVLFAASASSLSASAIAGVGTIALGSTLSPNFVTSTSSASPLNISATTDRSAHYVWTGGAGTVNLPALSTIPNPPGYFVTLNNKGSGTLQVTPNGSDSIDTVAAAEALNPGYAATYFASASGWYSFGFLSSTKFAFTELVQTVTGGTLTLSQTQAANVVQKYIGTLTGNQTVVFPPTVQVYYVQNATAGAFNLTFKSGAGTQFTLPAGQNGVLFSDGINVVNASNTISGITSLLLSQGSQTVPAIGFTVDPSTGIYQPASGQVAITISGAQNATFRAASLTAPAFIPSSSTVPSNGVYLPAANILGFATNGAEVGRFLANGNCLLGTTGADNNPRLQVSTGAALSAQLICNLSSTVPTLTANLGGLGVGQNMSGSDAVFFNCATTASRAFSWYQYTTLSAASNLMNLMSNGNLLLGTTTDLGANNPLQVVGNANATQIFTLKNANAGTSAAASIAIVGQFCTLTLTGQGSSAGTSGEVYATGAAAFRITASDAAGSLSFCTGGFNSRMAIAAAGNVTINAPTSGQALTINGITGTNALSMTDGTTTTTGVLSAGFYWGTSSNHFMSFRTNGVDVGRFLTTGSFLVGTNLAAVVIANDVIAAQANTNAQIGLTLSNVSNGAAAVSMLTLGTNTVTNFMQIGGSNVVNRGIIQTGGFGGTRFADVTVEFLNAGTTASAANAFLNNASNNVLQRSTSARRYKTDIVSVDSTEARDAIADLRPIRFRSKIETDDQNTRFYGFIAEEVAEVEPALVHWDKDGQPDGVQYDRLTVLLIAEVQQLRHEVEMLRR